MFCGFIDLVSGVRVNEYRACALRDAMRHDSRGKVSLAPTISHLTQRIKTFRNTCEAKNDFLFNKGFESEASNDKHKTIQDKLMPRSTISTRGRFTH